MKHLNLTRGHKIKPKYPDIADSLLQDIRKGRYTGKLPGIRPLSEKYKVQTKTMSKAIELLAEKGIVYSEPAKGTFISRNLAKDRELTVYLISSRIKTVMPLSLFYSDLFVGLNKGFEENDFDIDLRILSPSRFKERDIRNLLRASDDNIAFISMGITLDLAPLIKKINRLLPCISLMFREEGCNHVDADNIKGAYAAAQHLISLGHRNIAFIAPSLDVPNMRDNLTGYKKALADNGINFHEKLFLTIPDYDTMNVIIPAFMNKNPEVSAFFTTGDIIAVRLVKTLKDTGCRIPEDISLTGFDDLEVASLCEPPLTTVRQPLEEIGRVAAEKLVQLVRGEISEVKEILPCELIVRNSTAKLK